MNATTLPMEVFTAASTAISCLFLICNLVGNVLVITVIQRNKKLCNANTLLLSNLAISDLEFAIQVFINIIRLSHNTAHNSVPHFMLHALVSIYTLVALAVERFFAILKPFVHLARGDKSLLFKVMLIIWIIAGVLSTPGYILPTTGSEYATGKNNTVNATIFVPGWIATLGTIYALILLVFGLTLPSALIIFCYSRVIYHVWFNADANRATNVALLKSRRNLTKLFILLTIIFLITWTPTFARDIATQYFVDSKNAWKFELTALMFGLAGSTANPVVYSFRCPRFRQEVIKLLTCCSCRRRRRPNVSVFFETNRSRTRAAVEPVLVSFRS